MEDVIIVTSNGEVVEAALPPMQNSNDHVKHGPHAPTELYHCVFDDFGFSKIDFPR